MNALVTAIVTRCQSLVAGLVMDDPTTDAATVAIPVYAHALPVAEANDAKAEQAPYLVVRLVGLEESSGKHNPVVRLFGEIYTHDGVENGMADLLTLVDRLRPLVERGPGTIAGYKIIPPMVWQIGDKETGNQPHPFYQFSADLRFSGVS